MNNPYSKKDIKRLLEYNPIMSIAVNLDDKPISSVVLFTVDNDLSFYFLSKRNTYKSKALITNPKISLSTWQVNKYLIQAFGQASEVTNQQDFGNFYQKFSLISKRQGFNYWPVEAIKGSDFVVFKILTEWLRMMDLKDKTNYPYYTINL